jgi:hypothetical protein
MGCGAGMVRRQIRIKGSYFFDFQLILRANSLQIS